MNSKQITLSSCSLILALSIAAPVQAQEDAFNWSGKLQAGYQYDSNVNVRELDQNTESSDQALVTEAQLSLQWRPWRNLELKAGAQHSDYAYQEFDAFDLAITTLNGEASYDFDLVKVGVSRHDANAKLAGDDFLDYQLDTLYLSRLWGQQWFTRFAYEDTEKQFANISERDATATAYSGDVYWFTPSAQSFITFGYTDRDETAQDPQFSYAGSIVRLRWQTQTQLWGNKHTWQLGWQLEDRNYVGSMPDRSAARDEQRQSVHAKWQIPLNDLFRVTPKLEYIDNQSNFGAVDYQETTASLNLSVHF
ncbi:hypothetical protein [Pseudidiomarina sp.]|uniref:hypothetical protein n=1 Tax=Pseudidiomarina sp. TaxID=2081707 RepID=UPI003A97550E